MERLEFLTYEDFACEIADKFDAVSAVDDCNDVAVIAKYAEIKEIFKELVCIGYDICDVELEFPDMDEYNDEYVLALSVSGIWIEKFKREYGYLDDISTITYILDNCSSKAISHCLGKKVYEVGVGSDDEKDYEINGVRTTKKVFDKYVNTYIKNNIDEDADEESFEDPCEECCNDCNCFCDEDEDGNVHGFTVNKTDNNGYMSCSYYSSEGFDEDDMRDILELLGYRFKD